MSTKILRLNAMDLQLLHHGLATPCQSHRPMNFQAHITGIHIAAHRGAVVDIDELLAVSDSSVLRSNFSEYLRNMTEIANTCSAYDNTVPEHVFKKLIPQIQALDKQRDNLQKNIERLRQENKDPVKQSVFFSGCNTPEKLEKRYKALCKTYHPDMESGDDETFKALQNEYEMIKKTFS